MLLFSKNHLFCSIAFRHIIRGYKYSMAETVPKGSLFIPNLGNAELYIFKSSLSFTLILSWLTPINDMFLYT